MNINLSGLTVTCALLTLVVWLYACDPAGVFDTAQTPAKHEPVCAQVQPQVFKF